MLLTISVVLLPACSDDESPAKTGRLVLSITDAPAVYDEVTIKFTDIDVSTTGGWISIKQSQSQTIDLLEWNNGKSIIIGQKDMAPTKITQIRLMIDTAWISVDGQKHELEIPSGLQTGLKINVNFDIVEGVTYELVLDFDVDKSIVVTGNDKYKLQPVIRAEAVANTGSISGIVLNPADNPVARAFDSNNNEIASTIVNTGSGAFTIAFLPPGTYKVVVDDSQGKSFTQENIIVTAGQNKMLGNITLQ